MGISTILTEWTLTKEKLPINVAWLYMYSLCAQCSSSQYGPSFTETWIEPFLETTLPDNSVELVQPWIILTFTSLKWRITTSRKVARNKNLRILLYPIFGNQQYVWMIAPLKIILIQQQVNMTSNVIRISISLKAKVIAHIIIQVKVILMSMSILICLILQPDGMGFIPSQTGWDTVYNHQTS